MKKVDYIRTSLTQRMPFAATPLPVEISATPFPKSGLIQLSPNTAITIRVSERHTSVSFELGLNGGLCERVREFNFNEAFVEHWIVRGSPHAY